MIANSTTTKEEAHQERNETAPEHERDHQSRRNEGREAKLRCEVYQCYKPDTAKQHAILMSLHIHSSVMLIPANTFDVIPGCCFVAQIALPRISVLNACDLFRNHTEMLHVMAGGSLMTLRAVMGCRRRMAVARYWPFAERVTIGAAVAKEGSVRIFRSVARRTIEHSREDLCFIGIFGGISSEPTNELLLRRFNSSSSSIGSKFDRGNGKGGVSHACHGGTPPLMFDVTAPTVLYRRVKCGGFLAQECSVVSMTSNTFRRIDTLQRSMAGFAVASKECVSKREIAW